jgi:carboxyl-terminal processing protease
MRRNWWYKRYKGGRTPLWPRAAGCLLAFFLSSFIPSAPIYSAAHSDKGYFDIVKSIELWGDVYRQISLNYVDSLNVSKLMYAGIDGMLHSLDPYSVFLDKASSSELDELTTGFYSGIGIIIAPMNGTIFITSVVDGSPAAKAGIRVGDTIVAIKGVSIRNKAYEEVKELLKGPSGTKLTLEVVHPGAQVFTATILREEVRVSTVSYAALIGDVGYIEMRSFGIRSSEDLRAAFQGLLKQSEERHQPLKGLILDLRNNPGGLLSAAVDTAALFVSKGSEVVSIRSRLKENSKEYLTAAEPVNATIPLAVLINKQSASAAEIVSGAIQDLDRGVIIGERSFGKGLVQSVLNLLYDHSLKLTTAKYYTPSGRLIQKMAEPVHEQRKVLPDVAVDKVSTVFYTKKRRKVYGGGGIKPDIEIPEKGLSPFITELRMKGMFFLFTSEFRSHNPVVPQQPFDRKALVRMFGDFLRSRKFSYTSQAERRLNDLKESLVGTGVIIPDRLAFTVGQMKEMEILKDSEGVADALEVEILRHYDKRIARAVELRRDPVVNKAIDVLSDSREYSRLLHP